MEKFRSRESVPVQIEQARVEDIEKMDEVSYRTWMDTYPNDAAGITRDDIDDHFKNRLSAEHLESMRKLVETPSPSKLRLVARRDGTVVGICRVMKETDRNKLQALYVLPEYQEQGIGKALWLEAQKFLDQSKDTYLEVADYNENAKGFYKSLGFEETGTRIADGRFKMKSGNVIPTSEMVLRAATASRFP